MVKSLGVYFGHNSKVCSNQCWKEKVTSIDSLLKNWKKRKLTLLGKSVIIQSLVIAKITFLANTIGMDSTTIKILEKMIYNFIWEGKPDKIKRNVMIGTLEQGGSNVRNIECHIDVLRIAWIKRLLDSSHANWKLVPTLYFEQFGKDN